MLRPKVLLAYHFFHPDGVVSARLFSDLALGLHRRGWSVTVLTSNRTWGRPSVRLSRREHWNDVAIERIHRPDWAQERPVQRLLNSAWLLAGWLAVAPRLGRFDAAVVGSDPAFAPVLLHPLRRLWPDTALAHWCFDMYPEAIAADGTHGVVRSLLPAARGLMAGAYRSCDAIVDLGPKMRERLQKYPSAAHRETLVPWALAEPAEAPRAPDPKTRARMFGDAQLALLYSGTLGRAHDFENILHLARLSRARFGQRFQFAFATRGSRSEELRRSLGPADGNVRILPFEDEVDLARHLEAADVHLLSLREEWSGLVVPSKFFGSLALGRPVLYSGPADSDVARWIEELGVGWRLDPANTAPLLDALSEFATSANAQAAMQRRARDAYFTHFSKDSMIDRWDHLLRVLMARRRRMPAVGRESAEAR